MRDKALSRRDEILQALAAMLQSSTSQRITTAALARSVGVSEAALYRHFPSKTRMYEELLGFAEETLFTRYRQLAADSNNAVTACGDMLLVALTFAERNPGITRLLCGDALHGEDERLQNRTNQFFERLETELKQQIRLGEVRDHLQLSLPLSTATGLMLSLVEGRFRQYVRSRFQRLPTEDWSPQWLLIAQGLFR